MYKYNYTMDEELLLEEIKRLSVSYSLLMLEDKSREDDVNRALKRREELFTSINNTRQFLDEAISSLALKRNHGKPL